MERLLLEFTLRAVLVAAAAALIMRILRIRTVAAQHSIWTGVLAAMLALPIWIAWGPKAAIPLLSHGAEVRQLVVQLSSADSMAQGRPLPSPQANTTEPDRDWTWAWLGIYLLGAVGLLVRLAVGSIHAVRLNSAACAGPVTVGWFRPRVILPDCWSTWPQAQLDAILAHENAHVRRHDPLIQWVALLNRAVFWFHPLAWWLERRLSALAEEACDTVVIEQGHDPGDYAKYLLDLARAVQIAGARINVAGMAMPGSGLQQRIKKLLSGAGIARASRARVASAAFACLACSAIFAAGTLEPQENSSSGKNFDVASVKQTTAPAGVRVVPSGGFMMRKGSGTRAPRESGGPGTDDPGRIHIPLITMKQLLKRAYGSYYEINGPEWISDQLYAMEATMPAATTKEQYEEMLRNLIAERFQLKFHPEKKEITGYTLIVAKSGPKLREGTSPSTPAAKDSPPAVGPDGFWVRPAFPGPSLTIEGRPGNRNRIWGRQQTMADLVKILKSELAVPVSDGTGLSGKYDFTITYSGHLDPGGAIPPAEDDSGLPDIFSAIQFQLGLKLERTKDTVEVMVVDHIERTPTAN
jgi:bla regulator protein blaR1